MLRCSANVIVVGNSTFNRIPQYGECVEFTGKIWFEVRQKMAAERVVSSKGFPRYTYDVLPHPPRTNFFAGVIPFEQLPGRHTGGFWDVIEVASCWRHTVNINDGRCVLPATIHVRSLGPEATSRQQSRTFAVQH